MTIRELLWAMMLFALVAGVVCMFIGGLGITLALFDVISGAVVALVVVVFAGGGLLFLVPYYWFITAV